MRVVTTATGSMEGEIPWCGLLQQCFRITARAVVRLEALLFKYNVRLTILQKKSLKTSWGALSSPCETPGDEPYKVVSVSVLFASQCLD